jgi:cell division protein FtsB
MKRLGVRLLIVFAVWFAVQGGEYSTTALFRQHARERTLTAAIDSLQRDIDSLAALERRIARDPATQERIAREEFGMVRGDKELLFRFVDPDSLRGTRR